MHNCLSVLASVWTLRLIRCGHSRKVNIYESSNHCHHSFRLVNSRSASSFCAEAEGYAGIVAAYTLLLRSNQCAVTVCPPHYEPTRGRMFPLNVSGGALRASGRELFSKNSIFKSNCAPAGWYRRSCYGYSRIAIVADILRLRFFKNYNRIPTDNYVFNSVTQL